MQDPLSCDRVPALHVEYGPGNRGCRHYVAPKRFVINPTFYTRDGSQSVRWLPSAAIFIHSLCLGRFQDNMHVVLYGFPVSWDTLFEEQTSLYLIVHQRQWGSVEASDLKAALKINTDIKDVAVTIHPFGTYTKSHKGCSTAVC